ERRSRAGGGAVCFPGGVGDRDVGRRATPLRSLKGGVTDPLGTNRRISVDVRIVSSTNRDLQRAMLEGQFREDLYFRLNVFQVKLPLLRERIEDIPALAEAFLSAFARDLGKPAPHLAPEAAAVLQS